MKFSVNERLSNDCVQHESDNRKQERLSVALTQQEEDIMP